jgi:hypothetical protein
MTSEQTDREAGAGLPSRVRARLVPGESQAAATDLTQDEVASAETPIVDLADRSEASVSGVIRSVNLRPRANVPALVAEIYDGSHSLNLIFLGRRRIGGVVPGTRVSARGRVTYQEGTPSIFNPAYEIRPDK